MGNSLVSDFLEEFYEGYNFSSDCDRQINSLPAVDKAILVCNLLAQTKGHPAANIITHPDLDLAVNGSFIAVDGFHFPSKSASA